MNAYFLNSNTTTNTISNVESNTIQLNNLLKDTLKRLRKVQICIFGQLVY